MSEALVRWFRETMMTIVAKSLAATTSDTGKYECPYDWERGYEHHIANHKDYLYMVHAVTKNTEELSTMQLIELVDMCPSSTISTVMYEIFNNKQPGVNVGKGVIGKFAINISSMDVSGPNILPMVNDSIRELLHTFNSEPTVNVVRNRALLLFYCAKWHRCDLVVVEGNVWVAVEISRLCAIRINERVNIMYRVADSWVYE